MDTALQTRLEAALKKRAPGAFHFSELYGEGWQRLYIGDRVKLGNAFLRLVRQGRFPGVEDTGTKKGGGRLYRKTG
ncbi:DUF1413 domain-containing protein [Alloalcanivorax mobilis]|uniref:DUF1413 domain-containing protein n=1 Tax=Alloalcanivorax mobilis TaxID=2019569 RepID=UPI000B5B40F7|nr:DUF1413 domain-containing protein [Alloalcanivorax mobilis]ASK33299.1 DUF1413 domain-containing protein [Alcanivorax sp. N3-2A]|tara:strand:- start:117478 stop:117705 length:228 start_codon:yes stop_codon:yes gene_type:complete